MADSCVTASGSKPDPLGAATSPCCDGGAPTERRQSLLVILIGLVGEAADQRETAEPGGAARKRAAGACAEDQCAEAAERRAGSQLVAGDQVLQLGDEFVERLAVACPMASRARSEGAPPSSRRRAPSRSPSVACPSTCVGNVEHIALTAAVADHPIHGAALTATEQVAQHVLQIATAGRPLCAASRGRPRLLAATQNVAQQVLEASAARGAAALGATAGRLSRLFAATQDAAQQVLQALSAPSRRCVAPIVLVAARRHGLRVAVGDAALLRWLGIAALDAGLAAELAE